MPDFPLPSKLPPFHNSALLHQALTHRSYVNEHLAQEHNERLEFLGDAVLNFLSGEFLYQRFPEKPEGELTPLRSTLVDETQLAKFAIALNLGPHLKLGRGADLGGGRQNPNLLSCAFEAVIGAYFLDTSNISVVRVYVEPFFRAAIADLQGTSLTTNYKSRFQEWALANGHPIPSYIVVSESGPDHAKEFVMAVQIGPKIYGHGTGRKKQDAEKNAAKAALMQLELE